MNDEINLMLNIIKDVSEHKEGSRNGLMILSCKDYKLLLDYITNLQQENKKLKEQINQYENPDDMTLFYMWLDVKAKDKIKELQQEKEKLEKEYKSKVDDIGKLTSIIYKARKMIFDNYGVLDKYEIELLDDILQGSEDK